MTDNERNGRFFIDYTIELAREIINDEAEDPTRFVGLSWDRDRVDAVVLPEKYRGIIDKSGSQ